MYCEYALDPRLLNNWKDFRYFTEKFSWEQGRLISRYPKRWKKLVYEALGACGDIERKRIEDRLASIDDKILKRPGSIYDNTQDWLSNSINEHARKPFYAIVAQDNRQQHPDILVGDEIDETSEPKWKIPGKAEKRNAEDIANTLKILLQASRQILIIDPHFDPEKARFRNVLQSIIKIATTNNMNSHHPQFELHTSIERFFKPGEKRDSASEQSVAKFFKEKLSKISNEISDGQSILVKIWKQKDGGEKIHNRYILTNLWGVAFGIGLDESEGENLETDDIHRLLENNYSLRWTQYINEGTFNIVCDPFTIIGMRP